MPSVKELTMFAGLPQAMKLRDEAAEAPVVEVTEAEFVAAMMATGMRGCS